MFTPAKQTGNYATKSVTSSAFFDGGTPFFQAKLTVNQPGDTYEQEADRVADQVMRMKDGDAPVVQRTSLGTASGIMRKCDACEKEEEKKLHRKESGSGDAGGKAAPAVVGDVLSFGGGRPMDGGTRQFMESRFGQDFSSVRIHNDSRAAESASAIQARAYTSGRDIVFGTGEYRPGSEEGRRLLAHELVHVGQQNKGATIKIARSRNLVMRVETKGKSKWDLLAEELNNLSEEKQIERLEKLSENEIATFLKSKLEFQVVGERSRKFKLYIYHKHLKDKNWNEAVLSLNGLNDSDITKLISEATNQQLVELFKSTERILARGPRQSFILKSIQEYILSKTSKLSQRDRTSSESVEYIVLHQTGSSTVESTLNTYDKRIKNKEHVGAHYLVGKEGETFSTISDEKVVFHVRGNKDASIVNANSIGIEHVGMPHAITPPILKPKDKGFEMSDVRTQIKALNLSPKLKARILSNTDTALYTLLKANGWNIYEDITGAQKRATLRLIVHLMRKYNLRDAKGNMDLSKIKAHEEADKKTIGEGENITEFIQTMKEMIELVKQLNMGIVAREKAGEDVSEYKKIYESNGINLIHKWVDTIRMDDSSGEVDTVPDNFFNSFYSEVEKTRNAVAEISK